MSAASASKLFQPLRVGNVTLQHRVIMAPLTRFRGDTEHVHHDIAVEYYKQRSVVPGTLLVTEGTFIAEEAGGFPNVPGIWNDAQIAAWKRVTQAVHANGSFIFMQLWALGRAGTVKVLEADGHSLVSASDIPISNKAAQGKPRPLSVDDIKRYHGLYANAARNAIKAGFDGVEIHGANGYLVDQFTQDTSNIRTDAYGGSIENRTRFALEVVKAVTDAVGQRRTAIRIGPYVTFQDMHMKDPVPTFTFLTEKLRDDFPDLAYLHVIESEALTTPGKVRESTDFVRKIWQPKAYITANGYTPGTAVKEADEHNTLVAFGRWFISNPDLPNRIKLGQPLTPYNSKTFYLYGPDKPQGYIDYPLQAEVTEEAKL